MDNVATNIQTTSRAVMGALFMNCKTPRQIKYPIATHWITALKMKRTRLAVFIASASVLANCLLMLIYMTTNWVTNMMAIVISVSVFIIGMTASWSWWRNIEWPNYVLDIRFCSLSFFGFGLNGWAKLLLTILFSITSRRNGFEQTRRVPRLAAGKTLGPPPVS